MLAGGARNLHCYWLVGQKPMLVLAITSDSDVQLSLRVTLLVGDLLVGGYLAMVMALSRFFFCCHCFY